MAPKCSKLIPFDELIHWIVSFLVFPLNFPSLFSKILAIESHSRILIEFLFDIQVIIEKMVKL